MSDDATASEHERKRQRLAIAKSYSKYLTDAPNGMEHDLFGITNVAVNAPLALIQCSLQCEVALLERLAGAGLLIDQKWAR